MKTRPAASIEVRGLRKQFGGNGVVAIEDASLSIAPGEFVSVLGPSGCGKSTLLRCIAGLESPSGGSITVNGAPVRGPPEGLGMVFQRDALLDWRNVADNLMLPIDFRHGDRAAVRERGGGAPRAHRATGLRKRLSRPALRWHAPARGHLPRAGR